MATKKTTNSKTTSKQPTNSRAKKKTTTSRRAASNRVAASRSKPRASKKAAAFIESIAHKRDDERDAKDAQKSYLAFMELVFRMVLVYRQRLYLFAVAENVACDELLYPATKRKPRWAVDEKKLRDAGLIRYKSADQVAADRLAAYEAAGDVIEGHLLYHRCELTYGGELIVEFLKWMGAYHIPEAAILRDNI